ncbi:MAG: hypothetical protein GC179_04630 [Anaerolineaceae bacterium]|nr:hypothetical protein [Anaerolineaceae bacterium]
MFELDHMMDGKGSRSHIDEIAKEVKLDKLAHDAEVDERHEKREVKQQGLFASAVLMLTRWG